MLIPFGILGASGGGAAGAYELISTTALSSSAASVTFSSIPSTYKHLQIRMVARGNTDVGGQSPARLRFNSDTSSSYAYHFLVGNGSGVSSSGGSSLTGININDFPDSNATANIYGSAIIDILDSQGSKNKTTRSVAGTLGVNYRVYLQSGLWMSTSAITTVTIDNSAAFAAGSRFSLYGIRG